MILAAELNLEQIAQLIIPHLNHTQLNMTDGLRNTALNWAVKNKNLSVISMLLRTEAVDVLTRDCFDQTPGNYAQSDIIRHMLFQYQNDIKGNDGVLKTTKGRLG